MEKSTQIVHEQLVHLLKSVRLTTIPRWNLFPFFSNQVEQSSKKHICTCQLLVRNPILQHK